MHQKIRKREIGMCTCITYENGSFYFGRNLDLDRSFKETVTITPRNFPLEFRRTGRMKRHYAMIGMASKNGSFPLYAEAVNEKGLCMAGLNFPGNAFYQKATDGEQNLHPLRSSRGFWEGARLLWKHRSIWTV